MFGINLVPYHCDYLIPLCVANRNNALEDRRGCTLHGIAVLAIHASTPRESLSCLSWPSHHSSTMPSAVGSAMALYRRIKAE